MSRIFKIPQTKERLFSETITAAGFEVLPKRGSVHSAHGEDRTNELMALVTEIANEKGLDSQNYQCKGCGRNIGRSTRFFFEFRLYPPSRVRTRSVQG